MNRNDVFHWRCNINVHTLKIAFIETDVNNLKDLINI